MEWTHNVKGGGRNPWLKGNWTVELGDRSRISNSLLMSKAVWYTKGVLEIYINTYIGFRMAPAESARRIGKALAEHFGTAGGYICDISEGRAYRDYVQQRVCWYARCGEPPDISKIESVREVVESNGVEQEYVAVVKATGDTEYYYDSELPGSPDERFHIRKYSADQTGSRRIVRGRYWSYARKSGDE